MGVINIIMSANECEIICKTIYLFCAKPNVIIIIVLTASPLNLCMINAKNFCFCYTSYMQKKAASAINLDAHTPFSADRYQTWYKIAGLSNLRQKLMLWLNQYYLDHNVKSPRITYNFSFVYSTLSQQITKKCDMTPDR